MRGVPILGLGKMKGMGVMRDDEIPPYSVDFSTLADGAMPGPWVGSGTAAISGGKAVLTPTLGAEILADPGMEAWNSATDLTNWFESKAGTSTINREGTIKHAGNYSARMDVDATGNACRLTNTSYGLLQNRFYLASMYARTGVSNNYQMRMGANDSNWTVFNMTDAFVQCSSALPIIAASKYFAIASAYGSSQSFYVDDASLKLLTTNTMIRTVQKPFANAIVWASVQRVSDLICGVCAHIDDYTNPQNGLFAVVGLTNAVLFKLLAGALTSVISVAHTPVDGEIVKIVQNGTTVQLWANGQQVGTDQTVEAAAVAGQYHGLFASSPLSTINSFGVRSYA